MVKSLVVGGNGFLGSHLVDMLVSLGHDVSVFDRFSTGVRNYEADGVRQITADFLDRSHLAKAVIGQDYVFHFLSVTTPATAESDPTLDIRTNLAQTVDLFEFCADANVRRVYFASTGGAIYGAQANPSSKETDPTAPVSPYGIVKLAIENYLSYFKATRGLEHTIFRISNPYGPRQGTAKTQGLIPVVLNRLARGLPVVQFGDGSMVRDYVFVDDLMQMIRQSIGEDSPHDVYNLGHGEGHSVAEVFESIRRVTGVEFDVQVAPTPSTFLQHSVLDVARFNTDFGTVSYTGLDAGIRKTWLQLQSAAR